MEIARDLPRSRFDEAVSELECPAPPFAPWALSFSEDETELLALCLPYADREFLECGHPDQARLERFVADDDLMVCRWSTKSGKLAECTTATEPLLELYRRELECPDISKESLRERLAPHRWPGVKGSGQPGLVNRLYWSFAKRRMQRLSRRLERSIRDLSD